MSQAPTDPTSNKPSPQEPGLDAAQQSLSDALSVSFRVLKFVMALLTVVYIFSGVFRVQGEDIAIRYRFGTQIGTYTQGWHFGLPFPLEEVVIVPGKTQQLRLNESFWYDNPDDLSPQQLASRTLDPLKDSFLITGDTNVVHVQFGVNYEIDPDRVDDYVKNVGTIERANELVKTAAERGMIHYIATANVEGIITRGKFENTTIQALTQSALNDLQAGIRVQGVLIDGNNQSMPNQVRLAYEGVSKAEVDKASAIQQARRTYNQTLGETAGGSHSDLLTMIRAYEWALADEGSTLAQELRAVLDRSFRTLRLPDSELLGAIRQYQEAAAAAAGSENAAARSQAKQAADALAKRLADTPDAAFVGQAIAGQIASAISEANALRYQISNKAEQDYNKYASDLATYRKTPRLLAATRLQETRERVMADVLTQIGVGNFRRIDLNLDPEVQKEIDEADFTRRREEARRKQEEEANQ